MNIVLVDDDALVCASLKTILEAGGEVRVAATGGSGAEAVALYRAHRPDVLLMDIRMAGMTGLEAGESLLREFPDARILFLTTFSDDEYIVRALRMGAKGYLIKQDFESILPALRAVHAGQSVFGGEVMGRLPGLMQSGGGFDYAARGLSERERDVIELVAKGCSNKEIADALFLSEGTVRNYLSGILDKLELRDRTQLAVFYYHHPPGEGMKGGAAIGRPYKQKAAAICNPSRQRRLFLFVHRLVIGSSHQIIQRNVEVIGNFQQDFQLGFPRRQFIVLIGLFRYIAVNCHLILRAAFVLPARFQAFC